MVITFVIDLFGSTNNGTTVTCMRAAEFLKKQGHKIKVIAFIPADHADLSDYEVFSCERIKVPVFDNLILSNGMCFAKADEKKIADFIKDSDVVHLLLSLGLERKVRRIAEVMGITVTGAFHVQPENISYNIRLEKVGFVNNFIYTLFRRTMYRYIRHVHTPSLMMEDQMKKHKYKNVIHPISNGVASAFKPLKIEKPEELKDKYLILMVGRYSGEKRQDLIIKAIGHSKYNDKIQLILLGQGPRLKEYTKLSNKYLKNPCIFAFKKQPELIKTINCCDLYVHASDAESEAISCIESFSCGLVPVISDSKVSATNHFALDQRCLFKKGDYKSLMKRIEYFYEHPEVKAELSDKYIEYGKTFALETCMQKLEDMFIQAYKDHQEDLKMNRTYHTDYFERRRLKKVAKKIGYDYRYIFKDSEV